MRLLPTITIALLTLLAIGNAQGEDGLCSPPTPTNFRGLFIDECEKFSISEANCTHVWNTFEMSFAYMDASSVTAESYRPYFQLLPGLSTNLNTSVFWSRTSALVSMLSCMCATGANIVSSANVPSTAIINNLEKDHGMPRLRWCGTTDSSSSDGIEYDKDCNCSVSAAFFEEFSILFARAAEDIMFYLGYGENPNGTFSSTSFFAKFELPNLQDNVGDATVLVVHRKGTGESCGEGTLNDLRQRLEGKGIEYTCYDVFGDPTDPAQLPSLTECAMDIIDSVQEGREPDDSSGCFMRENSAVSGAYLSSVVITVTALVVLFAS